jgi:hypothetical protein
MVNAMKNSILNICDVSIQPGEKVTLALPTPELYTCTPMHIPIHIIHGKKKGPKVAIIAGLHGDEINGIFAIQKLLEEKFLKKLFGTLIAIPVVNTYGLIAKSRNLPDGQDLEGSFPGHISGSFASRLAYIIDSKILQNVDYVIDLHSGDPYNKHLSQIHTDLDNDDAKKLAFAFNATVIMDNKSKDSLLYLMHQEKKIPSLLFESGEAFRIDEYSVKSAMRGIINVLKELNMLPKFFRQKKAKQSILINDIENIYSPGSGICNVFVKLGSFVKKNDKLLEIRDPFGTKQSYNIFSKSNGIIISIKVAPLVNEGEIILKLAKHEYEPSFTSSIENNIETNDE